MMPDNGLTVIVPTIGRPGLSRTLRSIKDQTLTDTDEVLVVGDTLDGPLPAVERLVALAGGPFRYVPHAGDRHWYGFPQINHAVRVARPGNYLLTLPDDDVLTADALAQVRREVSAVGEPRPLMFRFLSPMGWVIPDRPEVVQANVSNQCFVVPNLPGRVADLRCERYESDYDWIVETLALWPADSLIWCSPVIAHARPKPGLYPDLETPDRLRLVIGAGGIRPPGDWVTVDSDPATGPDVCADGRDLPYKDGTVDAALASHVLEHLTFQEGQQALVEWHRILKPGGQLTVVVPDFRSICRAYLSGSGEVVEWPQGTKRLARDLHLINAMFLYSWEQSSQHKWMYDLPHLREALELAGFEIVSEVDRYDDPLIAVPAWYQAGYRAVKPCG